MFFACLFAYNRLARAEGGGRGHKFAKSEVFFMSSKMDLGEGGWDGRGWGINDTNLANK